MAIPNLTPLQKSPTNILPETGSLAVAGNAEVYAFGLYVDTNSSLYDANFVSGAAEQVRYTYRELGGDVLDIELTQKNVCHAYEASVLEYSYLVNLHQAQNVLGTALGGPTGSFNHQGEMNASSSVSSTSLMFPKYDFAYSRNVSDRYSSEANVGGTIPIYSGSIEMVGGQQDYNLQTILSASSAAGSGSFANLVGNNQIYIKRVYFKTPAATWRFFGYYGGLQAVGNLSTYGMYADDSTFQVIPPWQNKLQSMAWEDAIYTRNSHYSYELKNNKLRLFPIPSLDVPRHIWVEFSIKSDNFSEISGSTTNTGMKGVNNFNTLPFANIPFSSINSIGKHWIRRFALAISKGILAHIRGKLDSIPIPGDKVTLNSRELESQSKEEKEALRKELIDIMDKMTYPKLAEQEAAVKENSIKAMAGVPLAIYVG